MALTIDGDILARALDYMDSLAIKEAALDKVLEIPVEDFVKYNTYNTICPQLHSVDAGRSQIIKAGEFLMALVVKIDSAKDQFAGNPLLDTTSEVVIVKTKIQLLVEKTDCLAHRLRQAFNELTRPLMRPITILDLPQEILINISQYLMQNQHQHQHQHQHQYQYQYQYQYQNPEQWDIYNLRLTCQQLSTASSHFLLPSIWVGLSSESLDDFDQISQHPEVAKSIRDITIDLTFFSARLAADSARFFEVALATLHKVTKEISGYLTEDLAWNMLTDNDHLRAKESMRAHIAINKRIINSWDHFLRTGQELVDDQSRDDVRALQEAYKIYGAHALDQQQIIDSGRFSQTVAAAIARMPMVKCLCFISDNNEEWPYIDEFFKFRNDDHNYHNATNVLESSMLCGLDWSSHCRYGHHPASRPGDKGEAPTWLLYELPIEIARSAEGGPWMHKLDIHLQLGNGNDGPMQPATRAAEAHEEPYLQAFGQSVKSLSYHDVPELGQNTPDGAFDWTALFKRFVSGRQLQKLELGAAVAYSHRTPVSQGLAHVHASNLRELKLRQCLLRQDALEALLKHHGHKDIRIDFDEVGLVSGTWAEVLDLVQQKGSVHSYIALDCGDGAEMNEMDSGQAQALGAHSLRHDEDASILAENNVVNRYIRSSPHDWPSLANPFRQAMEVEEEEEEKDDDNEEENDDDKEDGTEDTAENEEMDDQGNVGKEAKRSEDSGLDGPD